MRWLTGLFACFALVAVAGAVEAKERYRPCYGDMAVSLLMEVSQGATHAAAEAFVSQWMAENEQLLDAGFTTVTAAMLDDLNIDRYVHEGAYRRALLSWRDCLRRVYRPE